MSDPRSRIERERLETAITDEFIENLAALVLVQGVLEDGRAHYAYVSIPRDRYAAFKQAELTGPYDIRDFGSVLYHGEGLNPPPKIQSLIEKHYGGTHQFEENARTMIRETMKELSANETALPIPSSDPSE